MKFLSVETKTYIVFKFPGSFVAEESHKEVLSRSISEIGEIPERAFALYFYERVVATFTNEVGTEVKTTSEMLNVSGLFYIDAEIITIDAVRKMDNPGALLSNMECSNWKEIIRCRTGNYQPVQHNDQFISSKVA